VTELFSHKEQAARHILSCKSKMGVLTVVKYKNNWIPLKTIEEMSKTNYDVLIVGSGPGGGAALYRLCELWKNKGAKKIGVLEMGDKLFHSHALNILTIVRQSE
jgi:hypothetical protein